MNLNDCRSELEELYSKKSVRAFFKILLLPFYFLTKLIPHRTVVIDHLEVVVGSRCTLRCRRCANLMQYYAQPVEFSAGQLKDDIVKLLELNVWIDCVHLIGGEPFLFKELHSLIALLHDSDKVGSIRIITNGTITPADHLLKYLRLTKVHILISNYVHVGARTNEIFTFLKEAGTDVRVVTSAWYNYHHDFSGFKRSAEEVEKIYKQCNVACHEMLNGEIHLCPTSAHGMYLGLIPQDENSFVSIRHDGTPQAKRKIIVKLRKLLTQTIPNACSYCSGDSGEIIPAAEQLPAGTYLDRNGNVCRK